jgi:DNA helicase-2/ATP-dependent DNA helicase PcrA
VITHCKQRQIFGTTRLGIPSRFIGDLPPDAIEPMETAAARTSGAAGRYIDRRTVRGDSDQAPTSWSRPRAGGWSHPQAAAAASAVPGDSWGPGPAVHTQSRRHRPEVPPSRDAGERYVEYEEGGDTSEGAPLRRGAKVVHERFGRGEVMKVVSVGEPAVVAFFPGWGEKKVLARFLKIG